MEEIRALVYVRDKVVVIEYYDKELNENKLEQIFPFDFLEILKSNFQFILC